MCETLLTVTMPAFSNKRALTFTFFCQDQIVVISGAGAGGAGIDVLFSFIYARVDALLFAIQCVFVVWLFSLVWK